MIEKLLTFDDILLNPAPNNRGLRDKSKYNFSVKDDMDNTYSLPIFTTPSDSIVNKENNRVWMQSGIRPILPRTEPFEIRLEACQYIFAAFTIDEVKAGFVNSGKRTSSCQFRVCIETDNGGDIEIFNLSMQLRKIYGGQIIIMAGNIGNPKTYIDYCKAQIDYARVGLCSGSLVDESKYGFYYPMASLLLDITGLKSTSCAGLKLTKIVADGGIGDQVDIIKAIALGADSVMIGREFVKLTEAAGTLYRREKGPEGLETMEEIKLGTINLSSLGKDELKDLGAVRLYCGNAVIDRQQNINKRRRIESRSDWLKVEDTLQGWLSDAYDVFSYGFMMADATNWAEFKKNIKFCRVR